MAQCISNPHSKEKGDQKEATIDLVNLIWLIPLAAVAVAVVFTLCSCAVAGEYDASSERDAAQVKDECYYCPFPCEHNK